jgi:hypothetical protein
VSLYDRIPCEVEERSGDFALVSLRVRDLFDAAKNWQDEITRNTMISKRGGKRRTTAVGSPGKAEQDQEASSRLQMEHMKQLVANPILSKVSPSNEFFLSYPGKTELTDPFNSHPGCHAEGGSCEWDSSIVEGI